MKGPKTMGNMLMKSYIDDLKSGPVDKKRTAAVELGNMGPDAKSALPDLKPLTSHADATLSAAAKQAIKLISK